MLREVKIIVDLYGENSEGEPYIIKENVQTNCVMDMNDIKGPFEHFSEKTGKPYKKKCKVQHNDLGTVVLSHPYNEVKQWILPMKIKGFHTK